MATAGSFLGIDLGAGTVKLVELRNEQGRPRLVTYGMYEVPLGKISDNDWSSKKQEAVAIIKQLLQQSKAQSKLAVSALPTFEVFSSLITVPDLAAKDLVNAIRLEAKKVVPRPLEEMVLDWKEVQLHSTSSPAQQVTPENNEESEQGLITTQQKSTQKKVLITAASKKLVDAYVEIFREAGLRLIGLETEAIALGRSLIGRDPSVVMVVDMGAQSTNLSIIEQGIAVVNRGVNFGGIQVTRKMALRMGVEDEQIEQWKRDIGMNASSMELSPVIQGILDDVLHEIRYLFQLYRGQMQSGAATRIEKIVLAGGSSFVPGLAAYLANQLNVPVHLGDPWARIVYPEDLSEVLTEHGPAMAVCVGLAMREILPK